MKIASLNRNDIRQIVFPGPRKTTGSRENNKNDFAKLEEKYYRMNFHNILMPKIRKSNGMIESMLQIRKPMKNARN